MQKDGTYSVIPRIPGGEITPDKLLAFGAVAKEYGLYTKINGAQRIGMYGARLEQLPEIWQKLIDAGFESGQAYGKSLRNVKSCIGNSWCRFGVQDSVKMAVETENRYKGLRSPHKFKLAVSGCNRECAEAQGKDIGLIATTNGWNLYFAGNGGANPAHGRLFAQDLDQETAYKYIDRYLMYYIRTADKLQRTARWAEDLDEQFGDAIEHLRSVIIDDSLGICADLDADMQYHIDNYEDEWVATLKDPERLKRFRAFVNQPEAQDEASRLYVLERDQIRPATPEELTAADAEDANAPVLITGAKIPVGAPA
jgi:nitrite reductase (NADH) large subunit